MNTITTNNNSTITIDNTSQQYAHQHTNIQMGSFKYTVIPCLTPQANHSSKSHGLCQVAVLHTTNQRVLSTQMLSLPQSSHIFSTAHPGEDQARHDRIVVPRTALAVPTSQYNKIEETHNAINAKIVKNEAFKEVYITTMGYQNN